MFGLTERNWALASVGEREREEKLPIIELISRHKPSDTFSFVQSSDDRSIERLSTTDHYRTKAIILDWYACRERVRSMNTAFCRCRHRRDHILLLNISMLLLESTQRHYCASSFININRRASDNEEKKSEIDIVLFVSLSLSPSRLFVRAFVCSRTTLF